MGKYVQGQSKDYWKIISAKFEITCGASNTFYMQLAQKYKYNIQNWEFF